MGTYKRGDMRRTNCFQESKWIQSFPCHFINGLLVASIEITSVTEMQSHDRFRNNRNIYIFNLLPG